MKKFSLMLVMLFATLGVALAQRTITGKVSDAKGEAIIGANVLVKGTTNGAATDIDGNYSIAVGKDAATIIISYVGFNTQEITLGASNIIDVRMTDNANVLTDVVVTALGIESSRLKSGVASTKVEGSALRSSAEVGVINALAGKSAGLNITSASGDPGAGAKIQIRGATSITGQLQPLIILDGIPIFNDSYYGQGSNSVGSDGGVVQQSRLNDIPSQDIESVEVLRGASAAALWGSKAANGVIVITTKKGKAGANRKGWSIDVNSSVSFDELNKKVDLQTDYGGGTGQKFVFTPAGGRSWGDKISTRKGGNDTYTTTGAKFVSDGGTTYYPIANGTDANVHGGKNSTQIHDVYDAVFGTGRTYDNNVSFNNVDEKGNVYFSFGNLNQQGIIKQNSGYNRTTARLSASRRLTDKFSIDGSVGYTVSSSDRIQMGSNLSGLFLGGLRTPTDFVSADYSGTYYDAAGTPFPDRQRAYRNPLGANSASVYDNPVWMMNNITSTSQVNRIIGKFDLKYDVTNWLGLTARIGSDQYSDEREDNFPAIAAGANNLGAYTKETFNSRVYNYNFFANARHKFSDIFSANLIAGVNMTDDKVRSVAAKTKNFINPFLNGNSENGQSKQTFDDITREKQLRYYATSTFDLWNQLYINASASYDFLSTLPDATNGVFYPAANIAWNASKILNVPQISSLKLRAGWGQVGRGPGAYLTSTGYYAPNGSTSTGFIEGWGAGLDPGVYGGGFAIDSDAGNSNLKPEIKTETEFGIDLGFLNDRFKLGATYYTNITKDLILLVDVPESTGFNRQVSNAGEIKNQGVELEWGFDVLKNSKLNWNIYGNFSKNKNEVTKMAGVNSYFLGGFEGSASRAIVGQQLGAIWGSKWERDGAGKLVLDDNGFPVTAELEGLLGDPNPDYRMGIGTTLSWKGLKLNVLFDMAQGMDMWNGTKGALAFFGRAGSTGVETQLTPAQAGSIKNYEGKTVAEKYPYLKNTDGSYTVRGEIKNFGGSDVFLDEQWYISGPGSGFTGPTEQFMEDASWARLRELTLSYTIPFKANKYVQGATISLTGRNLALWTKYTGNDPDQNLTGAGLNALGLDYFNNPNTRSYKVALNLNF